MLDSDSRFPAVLLNILNLGSQSLHDLVALFGDVSAVVAAGPSQWPPSSRLTAERIARIIEGWGRAESEAATDVERADREGVHLLIWGAPDYPALLDVVDSPPLVLYVKGDWPRDLPAIAVVGSRRCSYYGEKVAREIAEELSLFGVVTVSGLARGIDSVVHEATLKAGGTTVAVVGSGLGALYPPENRSLAERIAGQGAVVSEFPFNTKPLPPNFPRRNRVIAGLANGTVVVEGSGKSGSLITARCTAEIGRDVFAVPGPITSPLSSGPHRLIQSGAKLVGNTLDIIEEIPEPFASRLRVRAAGRSDENSSDNALFDRVLKELQSIPISREILASRLRLPAPSLSSALLSMEMSGLIRTLPGGLLAKMR